MGFRRLDGSSRRMRVKCGHDTCSSFGKLTVGRHMVELLHWNPHTGTHPIARARPHSLGLENPRFTMVDRSFARHADATPCTEFTGPSLSPSGWLLSPANQFAAVVRMRPMQSFHDGWLILCRAFEALTAQKLCQRGVARP